ncbi:hypothetical protein CYMTET_46046 [Cymbomonas tetramitiformis]|uniref:Uncharacterized protein n=1 Tax=Cymbomonas tetramitiformis TaxID=36881 RepID=A0AAE0BWZ8_9CHLO|nr:hypothetical protein CYMTET_46046 [Cymbomonas tetramitiformis]
MTVDARHLRVGEDEEMVVSKVVVGPEENEEAGVGMILKKMVASLVMAVHSAVGGMERTVEEMMAAEVEEIRQ